ncbi:MAG TPA: adenylate/guanylate cyclase domain-containing protein [Candidatus Cloacimonadota bacterium]|nr:adenylate/guanylate cyclase domain-containing protein [Candidatus Cloacimonadota bacterium]
MKIVKAILTPLIILAIIKLLMLVGFFAKIEHLAQDCLFRLRGSQDLSDQVVIVSIDDATFNALDERYPFPREYYAKLIHNLNLAGAKLIVFDLEFTESTSSFDDEFLAQTAAEYQNVVFAGRLIETTGSDLHQQLLTPVYPIMLQNLSWGVTNLKTDIDGVIRRYSLYHYFAQKPQYTLGVAALANRRVYQSDWDKHIQSNNGYLQVSNLKIPLINDNETLINYFGPAHHFPYYTFSSVIDDSLTSLPGQMGYERNEFYKLMESGVFRDKIVLVGADTAELHDYFSTPFSSSSQTPGVEIHANFIEMVLQQKYLRHLDFWYYLGIQAASAIILWFIWSRLRPIWGAIMLLILAPALYLVAYLLFINEAMILPVVQSILLLFALYIVALVKQYLTSLKEKRFIRKAFQQYMAPELVEKLLKDPKSLKSGGSLQEVTVLFSDIRGFSSFSEDHKPQETVQILKDYLTVMVDTIIHNDGFVDKFSGGEIMALFGTPVSLDNHALSACKTALQMRNRLAILQDKWRDKGHELFEISIGINTGQALVGNLGSEQIFDYTAIGDSIKLGASLVEIGPNYGTQTHIIISEYTYTQVEDFVQVHYLDEVKVKGSSQAVKIYEQIGLQ